MSKSEWSTKRLEIMKAKQEAEERALAKAPQEAKDYILRLLEREKAVYNEQASRLRGTNHEINASYLIAFEKAIALLNAGM